MDVAANVLPWLMDRRSKESEWFMDHQNGRSEGADKELMPFDRLYKSCWVHSQGGAFLNYPPLSAVLPDFAFSTYADYIGSDYDFWKDVKRATPPGWPLSHNVSGGVTMRDAILSSPYYKNGQLGDFAGLSALAPVYYTGEWRGHRYDGTFLGAVGIGIDLEAIAWTLNDLEGGMTEGSFACVANAETFDVIAISQSVVKMIYPERTGTGDEWIFDGVDRRNRTFLTNDTIRQGLTDELVSADWDRLHEAVKATPRGGLDYIVMEINITGSVEPRDYYAMFERWAAQGDFVMLAFAPVELVDDAIHPVFSSRAVNLTARQGDRVEGSSVLTNNGTLDIVVRADIRDQFRPWIELADADVWADGVALKPGGSRTIKVTVDSEGLELGRSNGFIIVEVVDDDYRDCFYNVSFELGVSARIENEVDFNYLGGIRVAGWLFCAIIAVTAMSFAVWVWRFWNTRVVRASQPTFLLTIITGCFLFGCTIIPLGIDDGITSQRGCDVACMSAPWLFSLGFTTIFAALFSKIWRINKIFHQANFRKITVTTRDVIVPFAVLLSFQFVCLVIWTVLDPFVWKREMVDDWSSVGSCQAEGVAHVVCTSLIAASSLTALFLACIQAYRARNISDEFSESKWIAISLGGMLQSLLLGIPLIVLIQDPMATFFINAVLIFVLSMSILLLMFVPKMHFMKKQKKDKEQKKQMDTLTTLATGNTALGAKTTEDSRSSKSPGLLVTHIGVDDLEIRLAESEGKVKELEEEVAMLKSLLDRHGISCFGQPEGARVDDN
uniref:G-protein coupled receptors family 3 profile domain-containing protein n=1 Tax=Odontella aurita TaxID=265563 RepID=A0A7S4JMC6_9STRA